jgi:hypothetical protein
MISKVKSQGNCTVELIIVGQALRLPTHVYPTHVNARQVKRLPWACTSRRLNSESGAVSRPTIDLSGPSQNSRHSPEAGHYRIRAANKRERVGSVHYLADAPGR